MKSLRDRNGTWASRSSGYVWGAAVTIALHCGSILMANTEFQTAEVTMIEKQVRYGTVVDDEVSERRARVADVLRGNNFLATGRASRAELLFNDSSLVRIGQESLFSFDSGTRDFVLDRGLGLFRVPPGSRGTQIRTSSVTCAITGTIVLVNTSPGFDAFYVLQGEIQIDGQTLRAGQALIQRDGERQIVPFNPVQVMQQAGLFDNAEDLIAFMGPADQEQWALVFADSTGDASLIEQFLPAGMTLRDAPPAALLLALAQAVTASPDLTPDIVNTALMYRREMAMAILQTAFRVLVENGQDQPERIALVVTAALSILPRDMSATVMIAAINSVPGAWQQIEFAFIQFENLIPEGDIVDFEDVLRVLDLRGDPFITPTPTPPTPAPSPTPVPVTPVQNQ